jgi:hypothetical protein
MQAHLDRELLSLEVVHHHEELLIEQRVVAALHRLAALQAALTDLRYNSVMTVLQ